MDHSDWTDQALCASIGTEFFYPESTGYVPRARALCRECPVQAYCRIAGIGERWGVWGGLGEHDREELRKKAQTPIPHNSEAAHARDMRLLSDRAWHRRDPVGTLTDAVGRFAALAWLGEVAEDARPLRTA